MRGADSGLFRAMLDSIHERTLPPGRTNASMFDLLKLWYRRCLQEHPRCKPPDPTFRPIRLIETLEENSVRLIETELEELHESYVVIPHCWGRGKTPKFLEGNTGRLQTHNRTPSCRQVAGRFYSYVNLLPPPPRFWCIQNSFDN
jgi:hypothetical protein